MVIETIKIERWSLGTSCPLLGCAGGGLRVRERCLRDESLGQAAGGTTRVRDELYIVAGCLISAGHYFPDIT